jgi:hypothetical protein
MAGYNAGFNECAGSGGGGDGDGGNFNQPREIDPDDGNSDQPREIGPREIEPREIERSDEGGGGGGINWENLCNQYGNLVGIKESCSEYADGTQLTEKGETALVCLLGGAVTLLVTLDPATKAEILALGNQYCP